MAAQAVSQSMGPVLSDGDYDFCAPAGGQRITFLGRPAVSLTLGKGCGSSAGSSAAPVSKGSHKRSRAATVDGDDDGPGGVQQVVRAMLRAQRLGVLVPLVLHCDPVSGAAVVEAVPGRSLGDLMRQAAAGGGATAGGGAAAATAAGAGSTAAAEKQAEAGAGKEKAPEQTEEAPAAAAQPGTGTGGVEEGENGMEGAKAGVEQAAGPKAAGERGAQEAAEGTGRTAGVAAGVEASKTPGAAAATAALDTAASALGRTLARLHDGGQVHGALGPDTVWLREEDGAVALTDFRRSFNSILASDKADDLAGLEAALLLGLRMKMMGGSSSHLVLGGGATSGTSPGTVVSEQEQEQGEQGKQGGQEAVVAETAATAAVKEAGNGVVTAQGGEQERVLAAELFNKVLTAYRATSRQWSATHNKLPEARAKKSCALTTALQQQQQQQQQQQASNKRVKVST